MKEASLYQRLDGDKVQCNLCAHRCVILPGKSGICRVRENIGGTLYTKVYGRVIAQHIDPVEKKPLYHFTLVQKPIPLLHPDVIFAVAFAKTGKFHRFPMKEFWKRGKR